MYNFLYARQIPGWNAPMPRKEANVNLEEYPVRIALAESKKLYIKVSPAAV